MRYFIFTLLLFATYLLTAQNTFIQPYGLEIDAVTFTSMILDNDTLVVSGVAKHPDHPNQQALLIAKIDTSGNILWSKWHFDQDGLNYSFLTTRKGLTKAPDNSGYYELGNIFEHATGVLIKYDNDGNFLWQKEYPDGNSLQDYYKTIMVLNDGLFILGEKDKLNSLHDVFVMKVDFEGNLLWQRYYSSGARNRGFTYLLKLNDNEFAIAGGSFSPFFTGDERTFSPIITCIDLEGDVLWEWEGALSHSEGGVGRLFHRYNGDWIYKSVRIHFLEDGSSTVQPSFVKRDSEFNLLSTTYYDTLDHRNNFYDMIPMQSGGFLAVGYNPEDGPATPPFYGYYFGWMVRLDADGNTLWGRLDLTPIDTFATANYWTTAVELESGSIIAVGIARTYINEVVKDWGSLIKVDKNGCIELSCAITDLLEPEVFQKEVNVYPNPFHDQINIETEGKYQVVIYNIYGQRVFYEAAVDHFSNLRLSGLLPGSYFIHLIFTDGQRVVKVVKG